MYVWEDITDKLTHKIEYAFLHRDIIERFIIATAHLSNKAEYWRDGLHIRYNNSKALIEVAQEAESGNDYPPKWIKIQCAGAEKDGLLQKIREEFNKIRPLDKATESVWQQNDWQPQNDKMARQLDGKGGFPEQQTPKIDFDKAETKRRLKQQVAAGKVAELLLK